MPSRFVRDINVKSGPRSQSNRINPLPRFYGGVQGSVIFRTYDRWVWTGPGTDGQVLKTQGADKDVAWATVSPTDAQYVVMALNGDLSAERVLTAGAGINLADGGANNNATLKVVSSPTDSTTLVGTGRTLTGGTGISAIGDLSADRTITHAQVTTGDLHQDYLLVVGTRAMTGDLGMNGNMVTAVKGLRPSVQSSDPGSAAHGELWFLGGATLRWKFNNNSSGLTIKTLAHTDDNLSDFSGSITDSQHGTRTTASAHAFSHITGTISSAQHGTLSSGDHHTEYIQADGTTPFTGAVQVAEGTQALPGVQFDIDPNTGLWHQTVDRIVVVCGGQGIGYFEYATSGEDDRFGVGRYPDTNALEVEGDASKSSGGSFGTNSDRKIKRDIVTINRAVDTINRLNPVSFCYIDEYKGKHPSLKDCAYFGFVAQDFQQVFPDSVKETRDLEGDTETLLQMDPSVIEPHLVRAVQELDQRVRALGG